MFAQFNHSLELSLIKRRMVLKNDYTCCTLVK